jgi:hypothetical protein
MKKVPAVMFIKNRENFVVLGDTYEKVGQERIKIFIKILVSCKNNKKRKSA